MIYATAIYGKILLQALRAPRLCRRRLPNLLKFGRYADAVDSYDRALSIRPDFGEAPY
jgi:hypothetical protein